MVLAQESLSRWVLRTARVALNKVKRSPSGQTGMRHAVYQDIFRDLVGNGDDPAIVTSLLTGMENDGTLLSRYDALAYLLDRHPRPHWVNYFLCMEEFQNGIDVVKSYPTYVWMDISSICTVECRFCKYTHQHLPKEIVRPEQVQSIEWLKYVRLLNLTSGTAEALSNPFFGDIFDYLRDTYPHLHLSFLTNGRTLKERALRLIAGRLDALHVSMNASNEKDYERIIANGSWRDFDRNMADMTSVFRTQARPKVSASFVMMRWNLESQLHNLDYAVDRGASQILFHHFYPHYIQDLHQADAQTLGEKFGHDDSLYHEQERADETILKLRARGQELGVEVITPPLFSEQADVFFGARSLKAPPSDCSDPWTKMYLLWGFKSRREEVTICCGLAADLGVFFDRDEIASSAGLMRTVRNHPTMRAYRRSVNGTSVNPICKLCRKVDRFAPDAVYPDQKSFFEFNDLPIPPNLLS